MYLYISESEIRIDCIPHNLARRSRDQVALKICRELNRGNSAFETFHLKVTLVSHTLSLSTIFYL